MSRVCTKSYLHFHNLNPYRYPFRVRSVTPRGPPSTHGGRHGGRRGGQQGGHGGQQGG